MNALESSQMRDYDGKTYEELEKLSYPSWGDDLDPYAELMAVVSTEPYMLVEFVTDGSDTGMGFIVSLNLRPTSM